MRGSSTPHSSYGASRPTAGWSRISSMRAPSSDTARARDDRRVSRSNTRTSNTTRPLTWSTVAPGLNAPEASVNAMSDGRTSGFAARRSIGAVTSVSAAIAPACVEAGEMLLRCGVVVIGGHVEHVRHLPVHDQPGVPPRAKRPEHACGRLFGSVRANDAERPLAHRRRKRCAIEECGVVVRVAPGVGAGGAGGHQSAEHALVILGPFVLRREILLAGLSEEVVDDRTPTYVRRGRAQPEFLHEWPPLAPRERRRERA